MGNKKFSHWEHKDLQLYTTSYLDGCVDVRELARLFVYDPRACEKFVKKIIDTGMDLSTDSEP